MLGLGPIRMFQKNPALQGKAMFIGGAMLQKETDESPMYAGPEQASIPDQNPKWDAKYALYMNLVLMAYAVLVPLTAFSAIYPSWCRFRHRKLPYNAKQLELRKDVLLIQFEPPYRPYKPKIGLRFAQAIGIYCAFKLYRDKDF